MKGAGGHYEADSLFFGAIAVTLIVSIQYTLIYIYLKLPKFYSTSFQESELDSTNRPNIKYQTVRIRDKTTFKKVKEVCLELWDQQEYYDDYNIKFVDDEIFVKIENENSPELYVDTFLKARTSVKKAQFVILGKNSKASKY